MTLLTKITCPTRLVSGKSRAENKWVDKNSSSSNATVLISAIVITQFVHVLYLCKEQ